MKLQVTLLVITAVVSLSFGCSTTAPGNQTSLNSQSLTKTNTESNGASDGTQNVTVTTGNQTLNVKQSNGIAEVNDGNGKSLRVETGSENSVADETDNGDDSDSIVKDEKGNRVTTKTRDGKQTSVVQSGDNKVRIVTENGKNDDSEVSDGKGNKVKMKNGKIEIQDADGKKVVVTTPN